MTSAKNHRHDDKTKVAAAMRTSLSNGIANPRRHSFSENTQLIDESSMWGFLLQSARAVSLWAILSTFIRLGLVLLAIGMNCGRNSNDGTQQDACKITKAINLSASDAWSISFSGLIGLVLSLAPSRVATQQAPGFSFANPWLLLWIRDKTGVIPNMPIRVCEYMLGRQRLSELFLILAIHVGCLASTSILFRRVLPERLTSLALEPLEYSSAGNTCIVDLVREAFVTALFTVAMLVLPVLFRLNHLPRWVIGFLLYPLFNYGVDGNGTGSSFSPDVVLSLSVLGDRGFPAYTRLAGSILGALVGGKIMQTYFPDDEKAR